MLNNKVNYYQVTQGVWGMKTLFVNIYMVANRKGIADGWVLIDAGLPGYSSKIIRMAEALFGEGAKPEAIILTHGHFDHTGSLSELLKHWDVPVYAHPLELPYLTGRSSYPPADPTVGGGLMSWLSWSYPTKPIDLGDKIQALDTSGDITELPEWKTIHTPGHSPGHVSLFFKLNATLIAGDAFVTTKTESAFYALIFAQKLSGPPKYLTTDWAAAAQSVRKLYQLEPRTVATGHGYTMRGKELQTELKNLADNFEDIAIPANGRYVQVPAMADADGVEYVPPLMVSTKFNLAAIALVSVTIGYFAVREVQKRFL
ncbi:glyoxylase-like metal-dependent hydrolase (beta-lactamase superfamily II) [Mucilaginibacter gracilis]|uniref:Glyoxylase-like metal-dependent hydrolase (Beta-lactamase superfamily II) n=2 Tax=Mucilaginibacter gracilis TaxID=423350 RepID=A0A495J5A2_9SPHI|nr:glyoxylase-like metal-dependent hydrolase (beta-lactamase superfamily II) [Mucilaginibacter gracilis]